MSDREQMAREGRLTPPATCDGNCAACDGRCYGNTELPWLEFEIPCPPSVNRFKWRLGNKSPNVQDWIGQADIAWVLTRKNLPRHKCKFEVQFLFGRNSRADFHNFEKPLFDWLQSREFVSNDKLCEWRGSGWSDDVPKRRVKVRLRPWMEVGK